MPVVEPRWTFLAAHYQQLSGFNLALIRLDFEQAFADGFIQKQV
jgi:hypothetical protein